MIVLVVGVAKEDFIDKGFCFGALHGCKDPNPLASIELSLHMCVCVCVYFG